MCMFLQEHVWGGKGVGSQGDGAAQFVVKSKEAQEIVCSIVLKDLGMRPLRLTIGGPTSSTLTLK